MIFWHPQIDKYLHQLENFNDVTIGIRLMVFVQYECSSFVYLPVKCTFWAINMVLQKILSVHEEKGGLAKMNEMA